MASLISQLDDEITSGLDNERARLHDQAKNADFFRGHFKAYHTRPDESTAWQEMRYKRESRIMEWLVQTLAADLYSHGPSRSIADHPEAAEWLNAVYKASSIDAILHSADEWATVSEVAAIQVRANADPFRPVRHQLWPAHQIVVWECPDDPLCPDGVATIDVFDQKTRLQLWTADEHRVYCTEKLSPGQTSGGRKFTLVSAQENPYGIIPFAFMHYFYPTTEFWSGGPGDTFRELNDYINFALTEVGDSLRYCSKPISIAKNVRKGWQPRVPIRPGDIWDLPSEGIDADGNGPSPSVEPYQFDLGFVGEQWADMQSLLDHTMQCADVPPAAFRMVQDSARSGLSIVAERMPLVARAEKRQRLACHVERDLARVTLAVGGSHLDASGRDLGHDGLRVSAGLLETASLDPDLSLKWPSMKPKLQGVEADQADAWRLQNGLKSRTMILMERDDLTREEAEATLEMVAKDLAREKQLLAEVEPARPTEPARPSTGEAEEESEESEAGETESAGDE